MISFKVLFCIAFGLLVLASSIEATCNVCSDISFAACLSKTTFNPCYDGVTASKEILTCKENTVCTDTQGVCQPDVPGVVLGCEIAAAKCNDCSGGSPFACVTQTQFAFCTADGKLGHISNCEQGMLCSMAEYTATKKMCGLSCVVEPTCQNTEIVTPKGDWKESCVDGAAARYYLNIHDTSCNEYVYCEKVDGTMNAIKYTCGAGYFDEASQMCVEKKPSTCY